MPPKQIQREAILDELYSGKTIEEVNSVAKAMIDTRKISSVKQLKVRQYNPLGKSQETKVSVTFKGSEKTKINVE